MQGATNSAEEESRRGQEVHYLGGRRARTVMGRAGRSEAKGSCRRLLGSRSKNVWAKPVPGNSGGTLDCQHLLCGNDLPLRNGLRRDAYGPRNPTGTSCGVASFVER